ncbi:hypothetical protein IGL98_002935 [Enterococcus sp. DIV0840]
MNFEVNLFLINFQKKGVKCCSKNQQWYTANEANFLSTELRDKSRLMFEKAAGGIVII